MFYNKNEFNKIKKQKTKKFNRLFCSCYMKEN